MKQFISITIILFSISFFSCNSTDTTKAGNERGDSIGFDKQWASSFIDSVNKVFAKQVAAGDSVSLANMYWPDAELLLDNGEAVKGNGIVHAWGAASGMGLKEMKFTTTDIAGGANLLVETGLYEMKSSPTNLIDKGNYVVVWQKRGEQWKIYRDIGATSRPLSKP